MLMSLLIFNSNGANNALPLCGLSEELREPEMFFYEQFGQCGRWEGGRAGAAGEGLSHRETEAQKGWAKVTEWWRCSWD